MASIEDVATGADAAPDATPPPEWVAPRPPWGETSEAPRGAPAYPSSPPLAAQGGAPPWGSGWPAPAPPPPPGPPTSGHRSRPGRFLWALVAALLIGGLLGGGLAKVVHLHGARPTLSASPSVTTPVLPTVPGNSASPTSPSNGTGSTGPIDSAAIAKSVNPSIVDINTVSIYQGSSGAGTGMILTSTGDILTNNHVIDGATSISVTLVSTGRTYKAKVVGTAPTKDIAVIRISGVSGLKPISIGDSSAVAKNDAVVAIGNAGGKGGAPSVVTGTVLDVNQTITASDASGTNPETLHGLIRTSAPIQPGDSGGALINRAGKIIGINTAASANRQFSGGTTEGFAIPITSAVNIARQIESGKASSIIHIGLPGFLGVSIAPDQSVPSTTGAVVAGVESGLPAAKAGLQAGDTITSIDGSPVTTPDSLSALTKKHRGGDKVTVAWTSQDGSRHSASVTLVEGPAD